MEISKLMNNWFLSTGKFNGKKITTNFHGTNFIFVALISAHRVTWTRFLRNLVHRIHFCSSTWFCVILVWITKMYVTRVRKSLSILFTDFLQEEKRKIKASLSPYLQRSKRTKKRFSSCNLNPLVSVGETVEKVIRLIAVVSFLVAFPLHPVSYISFGDS